MTNDQVRIHFLRFIKAFWTYVHLGDCTKFDEFCSNTQLEKERKEAWEFLEEHYLLDAKPLFDLCPKNYEEYKQFVSYFNSKFGDEPMVLQDDEITVLKKARNHWEFLDAITAIFYRYEAKYFPKMQ